MNGRELDVLNILWKKGEPMMATDIVFEGKGLTQSTVTAVLRKLLNMKYVEVVGVTHSGKVLGRIYRPTEAAREAIMDHMLEELNRFSNIVSLDDLQRRQQEQTF